MHSALLHCLNFGTHPLRGRIGFDTLDLYPNPAGVLPCTLFYCTDFLNECKLKTLNT